MPQAPILIHLFGPPEFRVNGKPLPRLKTRKGLYILALLALRHDRDVERSWLAGTVWPENDEETARAYLRQSLSDLRNALGDAADRLLSPSSRTLRLDLGEGADVDFITFRQCLKRGDTASLEQAVSLYRGPLLEGWAEDWLLSEREASVQAYLGALETLAQQTKEGDTASAIRYLREIVAADPLRESAHRSLMQALAATRDYAAVTQVYRTLRTILRREVNAEPDTETQALFARLRAEAKDQAATTSRIGGTNTPERAGSPPKSAEVTRRSVSLPRPLSEFIGRNREVESIKRALTSSRLVTLAGIGGVGKTRLSLRVAEEIADDFPDGVYFVDLSPLTDPTLVSKTAAVVLGIEEQADRSLTDTLCEHLREWNLLLILDNCEHLTDACARFVAALLAECPNLRILATSRQRLGITGETVRRIPPLTLPDLRQQAEEDKNAASALMEFEAVRLFVDRAQRVQPNLVLNQDTLRSIAVLCRRLDGIPLALELAAARMSALGPEHIVARLKERFRLLSGGDRTAPDRQRTLRGALDWSYHLLQPEEQVLLGRLSVFAGGWTLEAAEAVCASPDNDKSPALEEWEVLDGLTGLVNHSLVVQESGEAAVRYRLLETVREYAQERLRERATDGSSWLRTKHREYFRHWVQEVLPYLNGPDQFLWLDRLQRDHDNLRATLDDCLDEGTPEAIRIGLQIVADLQRFWLQRGHISEGRRYCATLLARDTGEPTPERARALERAGILAYRQFDFPAARELLEAARSAYRQSGNPLAEALPLNVLGSIAHELGDYEGARILLEEALDLQREAGYRHGEAAVLNTLGLVMLHLGDYPKAGTLYNEALAIIREIGDRSIESNILNRMGVLAVVQKDFQEAQRCYEQALLINREIGDSEHMMGNLNNMASTVFMGGNTPLAEQYYRQALLLTRDPKASRVQIASALLGLSFTAHKNGRVERATKLLGAAMAQLEAVSVPLAPEEQGAYDQLLANLDSSLGAERFTTLWNEGRTLRLDQAVTMGLEQYWPAG